MQQLQCLSRSLASTAPKSHQPPHNVRRQQRHLPLLRVRQQPLVREDPLCQPLGQGKGSSQAGRLPAGLSVTLQGTSTNSQFFTSFEMSKLIFVKALGRPGSYHHPHPRQPRLRGPVGAGQGAPEHAGRPGRGAARPVQEIRRRGAD